MRAGGVALRVLLLLMIVRAGAVLDLRIWATAMVAARSSRWL